MPETRSCGWLALIGGKEWEPGCSFDEELIQVAETNEVLVLPTAAAYEHPARSVEKASAYFSPLGVKTVPLMVLSRSDAEDKESAEKVRQARFIYLSDGSVMHLRSVLKDSLLWGALMQAWNEGALVAGSSAGAMIFGDSMVDPRGGALTVGLGLLENFAFLPHADTWSHEKTHRTLQLSTGQLHIVTADERTALLRSPEGSWRAGGAGKISVWLQGAEESLDALRDVRVDQGRAEARP